MSHARQQRPPWQIRRTFETNRLSPAHLAEAYEQIVPIHIRIVSWYRQEERGQSSGRVQVAGGEGRAA